MAFLFLGDVSGFIRLEKVNLMENLHNVAECFVTHND